MDVPLSNNVSLNSVGKPQFVFLFWLEQLPFLLLAAVTLGSLLLLT